MAIKELRYILPIKAEIPSLGIKIRDFQLRNKKCRFIEETGTRKAVHVTLITTYGVKHNEYWKEIQSEVTADDLFIK